MVQLRYALYNKADVAGHAIAIFFRTVQYTQGDTPCECGFGEDSFAVVIGREE